MTLTGTVGCGIQEEGRSGAEKRYNKLKNKQINTHKIKPLSRDVSVRNILG